MAINSQKMTRWAWDTKLSTLATNTTLGTATRYDTEVQTMYVPETTRAFECVILKITLRDAETTTPTDLDGIRIGIKINSVAFSDQDLTTTVAHTSDPWTVTFERDVTSYFTTNDPGTSSFSIQAAVAVQTGAASNVNNITFELLATYRYDDGASTHADTAMFPIQTHHTILGSAGTYVQVGTTGGTANAPANQIRQLTGSGGAFDGVTGFTLRKRYLIVIGTEGNTSAGATDLTFTYRFDGGGTTYTRATLEEFQGGNPNFQDIIDITALSTSAAHSFEVTCDVASRGIFGALDVVTYEFTASSTQQFVSVVLPWSNDGSIEHAPRFDLSQANAQRWAAELYVSEPSTVTMDQSGIVIYAGYRSTTVLNVGASGQTERTYTQVNSLPSWLSAAVHRCDHSSSTWTLTRGMNKLPFLAYVSVAQSSVTASAASGYAIVNYRCSKPVDGASRKNRTVALKQLTGYNEVTNTPAFYTPGAPVIQETDFYFQSALAAGWDNRNVNIMVGAKRESGEAYGGGWWLANTYAWNAQADFTFEPRYIPVNWWAQSWKPTEIEVSRTWRIETLLASNTLFTPQLVLYGTYHSITFTVAGTVEVDGTPVANSKTVQVFAIDSDDIVELVGEALTTGGTGSFTLEVPDDTRTYWASYKDGTTIGRSDTAVPESGTFDITISTGTGSGTRPVGSGRVRRYG